MDRRSFFQFVAGVAGASAGAAIGSSPWSRVLAASTARSGPGPYGPLLAPDENGIQLPKGFRSRRIARAGEKVAGTSYTWPVFPDGGACFPAAGGWIYAANSEFVAPTGGGASAIRFSRSGEIEDAYSICSGTSVNCAGGAMPWGTWLTCEEHPRGLVWECDPRGRRPAMARPALGTFQHEAVAADRTRRQIYLTEDVSDGRFYRFTPARWGDLSAGRLEVAAVAENGAVSWFEVPEPNPTAQDTPTRLQVSESTAFRGGEGIVFSASHVYFTTKGDNRVWDYDTAGARLTVLYDYALDPGSQLSGVDNITVARSRDLVVAEDPGNLELVLITPDGIVSPLLRVVGQDGSELAGPAFSPSGRHLYFSSQRGFGQGVTYVVTGPFRQTARSSRGPIRLPVQRANPGH